VNQVVHHHYVLQSSILDDPQVLDVQASVGLQAVSAVQYSLDGLLLLVEIVDDGLGVVL
jgi:hypothetical protein